MEREHRRNAVERMRELERQGVSFSRNRNFELFEKPENRRALALHRHLNALEAELREGHDEGMLELELDASGDETPLELRIRRTDKSGRQLLRLEPEELEALGERPGVGAVLDAHGVVWRRSEARPERG